VEDLDPQIDAVFEHRSGPRRAAVGAEASHTVVMDFDAAPLPPNAPARAGSLPPMAEATRIELELDEPLDAPPKDTEDEVDDLFMELLED
jgi:hypothetical protein